MNTKFNSKVIVCIMGATATGKSQLALQLAKIFPSEIVSVDSAMIYNDMNIGTATPDQNILSTTPHHLINILDPCQVYSAAQFQQDALTIIDNITKQKKLSLLVGGTCLYFRTLQQGLTKLPAANIELRKKIEQYATLHGWSTLHSYLQTVDPIAAQRISPNDPQRLQRALEIYQLTGKTVTELYKQPLAQTINNTFVNIVLMPPTKAWLQQQIELRLQQMLNDGFIDEVRSLHQRSDLHSNLQALRTVGYKQVWQYLNANLSYTEMQQRIIIATRQLAKRQLTWLKNWPNVHKFDCTDSHLLNKVCNLIKLTKHS